MTSRIFRCKRIKPGDGGMVDGCGWQGPEGHLRFVGLGNVCPECGSPVREVRLDGSALFPAPVVAALYSFKEKDTPDGPILVDVLKPREIRAGDVPIRFPDVPWHACTVTFLVTNVDHAQNINLHPNLPKGWMLLSSQRCGVSQFYKLEFEVQGTVNVTDGETVKRIVAELGM